MVFTRLLFHFTMAFNFLSTIIAGILLNGFSEEFDVVDEWNNGEQVDPTPASLPTHGLVDFSKGPPSCFIPADVCAQLSDLFTLDISKERLVEISKEFPVWYELEGTAFRPPKRGDWLDRRAKEKNVTKQIAKFNDVMAKLQFKFTDVVPPILVALNNTAADTSPTGLRTSQAIWAAVQWCGHALVQVSR